VPQGPNDASVLFFSLAFESNGIPNRPRAGGLNPLSSWPNAHARREAQYMHTYLLEPGLRSLPCPEPHFPAAPEEQQWPHSDDHNTASQVVLRHAGGWAFQPYIQDPQHVRWNSFKDHLEPDQMQTQTGHHGHSRALAL
jgi:hypothetical protein